ncbi:antibiotic biosynthesis monooxygenase [Streptomyces griseus]|uniref:antibiotic biosynthesis monooxygenase family protein n=1 Tax=Streptomyces griseus TaxID=1911 RepID=UPI00055C4DEE|nr:antibiotic biosynthesis monooxygenase family protein [Streptomyces griseus]
MLQESKTWSSGNWHVKAGQGEDFVERWQEFLTWTKENNDGFLGARLIRNLGSPQSFVSFAAWQDLDSMRAWQSSPEFTERLAACRALCEDMQSGGYELACAV